MNKSRADFLNLVFKEQLYYVVGTEIFSNYNRHKNKKVAVHKDRCGYLHTRLSYKGKRRDYSVHQIIYVWYLGSYSEEFEINHKDGNKLNNSIQNLELCNRKENMKHAFKLGLVKLNPPKKYSEDHIKEVQRLIDSGLSRTKACHIVCGSPWMAKHWKKMGKIK